MLNREEILLILGLMAEKYGSGYSDDPQLRQLQAKLAVMLEVEFWKDRPTSSVSVRPSKPFV